MQLKLHMVTIEDLVPEEHFLRKLEAALDLSFIYRETEKLYSRRYGRPPIDPVVLVKYLLDRVPDHGIISQFRRRKPSFRKPFRRLFEKVVGQCVRKGPASGRQVADAAYDLPLTLWGSRFVNRPRSCAFRPSWRLPDSRSRKKAPARPGGRRGLAAGEADGHSPGSGRTYFRGAAPESQTRIICARCRITMPLGTSLAAAIPPVSHFP